MISRSSEFFRGGFFAVSFSKVSRSQIGMGPSDSDRENINVCSSDMPSELLLSESLMDLSRRAGSSSRSRLKSSGDITIIAPRPEGSGKGPVLEGESGGVDFEDSLMRLFKYCKRGAPLDKIG